MTPETKAKNATFAALEEDDIKVFHPNQRP